MQVIAWDTETHLHRPGCKAPPMVCMQVCAVGGSPSLMLREEGLGWIRAALEAACRRELLLVGHGVTYDLCVVAAADPGLLPLIFRALEINQLTDTELRQKLADIGRGRYRTRKYDLGACGRAHGYPVNKDDPWRLRYSELDGVPLSQWPEDALRYALDDAACTAHVWASQEGRYAPELLIDQYAQLRRFFALELCSAWGLRTSQRGVVSLELGARERLGQLESWLVEEGLLRANGSRDTKAAKARMVQVCTEEGLEIKLTKSGDVCLDSDACKESGDPLLEAYTEVSSLKKVLSNDVEWLAKGIHEPIHTNFDVVVTGRTSSSRPNVQNPRRLPGVREAYVPRGFDTSSYVETKKFKLRSVS